MLFIAQSILGQSSAINGVSIVSSRIELDSSHVEPINNLGANWIAVVPFADQRGENGKRLEFDQDWQWYGDQLHGVSQIVKLMKKAGYSVMIKPQIREKDDRYVGKLRMHTEEDWVNLENDYRNFILAFVAIAEEEDVEMFCIGTELKRFTLRRSEFWMKLIKEIRSMYSGKILYAANWNDYRRIKFWDQLDYIGIDAYFGLSHKKNPSTNNFNRAWKPILSKMSRMAQKQNKKVILTEYGYRSVEKCATKPWDHGSNKPLNYVHQADALKAIYSNVFSQPFILGGFLWRWHPNHSISGGSLDDKYTVQNKLAEEVVREHFQNK